MRSQITLIKKYISLTKPGIIFGNAVTAAAGCMLASRGHASFLWLMLIGLSSIIASSCVINNYIDRDIDIKMNRTKNRALVTGDIPVPHALVYACILFLVGVSILYLYTNLMALLAALVGFVFYVVVYSLWAKRYTEHATVIGAVAGAIPPLVGYVAVYGVIDLPVVILFVVVYVWQMPHFFAIALYRKEDYAAAAIPVLPARRSVVQTQLLMTIYVILFGIATALLPILGYVGRVYTIVDALLVIGWLWLCARGFLVVDTKKWARTMFFYSLLVIMLFSVVVSLDTL